METVRQTDRFAFRALLVLAVTALAGVGQAHAHASEQMFVLLLPTGVYTAAGVAAVALTAIVLGLLPDRMTTAIFSSRERFKRWGRALEPWSSVISALVLAFLVYLGFSGPHDPLTNLLPLVILTIFWVGIITVHAFAGDFWRFINPWSGIYHFLFPNSAAPAMLPLPRAFSSWPAAAALLLFMVFYLAYPAPDDPSRLAVVVAAYWLYTFSGMVIFGGEVWLSRGECFTVLMRHYASLAPCGSADAHAVRSGIPGWQIVGAPALSVSGAVFVIMILASGSFDGLNETFWWLAQIDVNPLEFPGRSAVIWQTVTGLVAANMLLPAAFAAAVALGLAMVGESARFAEAFGRLARTILPIAAGYHVAHYLISFLINGQYFLAALNDPWAIGSSHLWTGPFYVTTGFLNSHDSVQAIFLTQAAAIVAGHMLAVLLSHAIAIDMFGNARKALVSQIPPAVFMIAYTLFGLWLLAAPRGA